MTLHYKPVYKKIFYVYLTIIIILLQKLSSKPTLIGCASLHHIYVKLNLNELPLCIIIDCYHLQISFLLMSVLIIATTCRGNEIINAFPLHFFHVVMSIEI